MATQPTIREDAQFGVGQFKANATFQGLLGLRFAWGATFGRLFPQLDKGIAPLTNASALGRGLRLNVPPNLFTSASDNALAAIGKGLTATQPAAADEWVTRAWALDGIGASIEQVALDTLATRKHITTRTKPRTVIRYVRPNVRAQLAPYVKRTAEAEARASVAEHKATALEHRVATLERHLAKPHAIAVPGLIPRVGGIERELDRLKGRVGRIGKWATLAGLIAAVAKVLEKLGVNYIRCGNVKRFGKRVCGMDSSALDNLLAGTVLIIGTVSLVEFAKGMQGITAEIEQPVRRFWRVV